MRLVDRRDLERLRSCLTVGGEIVRDEEAHQVGSLGSGVATSTVGTRPTASLLRWICYAGTNCMEAHKYCLNVEVVHYAFRMSKIACDLDCRTQQWSERV
jgi:hypothetical protein